VGSAVDGGPVRFGPFEVDIRAGELRKYGVKLKLSGQPFQVLAILLERPGQIVTREELQNRLWPDTFVDAENSLNTAINKIREVLGDSAASPRFIETLPRRGYRFIFSVKNNENTSPDVGVSVVPPVKGFSHRWKRTLVYGVIILAAACVGWGGIWLFSRKQVPHYSYPHPLSRISFDAGLQLEPTWSPDGHLIAYASDRDGKLDIWIQQVSGGEPIRVTHAAGNNWQPAWSPDGKYIAYRSEAGAGLFIIPALGSEGPGRRISSFGYRPQWSPDGTQILFQTLTGLSTPRDTYYVVGIDGNNPQVVLNEFLAQHPGSVAWYPGGERVSVWEKRWDMARSSPNLWTVPIRGGPATRWEISPELAKQFEVISAGKQTCDVGDSFSWAPSGKAAYFACEYRGATNLWKMTLNSETMRATSVERLTAGPGPDEDPAVSPDGKRIAFSSKSQRVRVWLLPFDSNAGRILGQGSPVTSTGSQAYEPSLSPDGRKLAFSVLRAGRWEIWEKLLPDGQEIPLLSGDYDFEIPQWSRDSKRLAYRRVRAHSGITEWAFALWSEDTRTEELLTGSHSFGAPYDWWPDDKSLLVSSFHPADSSADVQRLYLDRMPHADESAQTVASRPGYSLWQGHASPDGKRVVFMGGSPQPANDQSAIYVIPSGGGSWIPITDTNHWTDKPRWSPNGKLVYYVAEKNGFLNVWGIHFDMVSERPMGLPFQITAFESPTLMFPSYIEPADISLAPGKLAITLQETSGSVWVLDNVDQ